jgi:hypothetical protein
VRHAGSILLAAAMPAPARDRWAVFAATLYHGALPSTEAACASRQAALRSALRRAIATMHVVRIR